MLDTWIELEERGISLRLDGEDLVTDGARLTPALRDDLKRDKSSLVTMLRYRLDAIEWAQLHATRGDEESLRLYERALGELLGPRGSVGWMQVALAVLNDRDDDVPF